MQRARSVFERVDAGAAVVAGLAAGTAFLATMEADLRLTGRNVDDRVLLGSLLAKDTERAKTAGTLLHGFNSVGFALVYAAVCDRIPGPSWWKGVLFFNAENVALYPITAALERFHPAIREGRLASYWTWPAFVQSIPRHVAFGIVLGLLYERMRRR